MARKIPIERVGEMMKVVLTELQNAGGQARLKDLLPKAEPKLNLTDYEREPYEKSGYIRWQSIVHFYSIDCVKAGYIQKSGVTPRTFRRYKEGSDSFSNRDGWTWTASSLGHLLISSRRTRAVGGATK